MARVPRDEDLDDFNPFGPGDGGEEGDYDDHDDGPEPSFGGKPVRVPLIIVTLAAIAGAGLAARSTSDFVAHLDRQVHAIHCSVGVGAKAELGESGCRTVMLSPYSSWFRDSLWGGMPISVFALAVFAFLAYRAGYLAWRGRPQRSETFFLLAGTALPCLMSGIYGWIAATRVGTSCTVCVGMYWASGIMFVAAVIAYFMTDSGRDPKAAGRFALGFGEGCAFVGIMAIAYLAFVPEVDAKAGRGPAGCGTLVQKDDPAKIMIELSSRPGGAETIELLDPLCPACRAFDERLTASGLDQKLSQKVVLFPLDSECNWMLKTSLHPGACAVTEAMLCAPKDGKRILDWAFAHQEALMASAKKDSKALRRQLETQFPQVADCLGGPQVKNKVVKSLRWAVANALPVLTPQVFVEGRRVCDEDTDLGLEYTLTRMLEGRR